MKITNNIRITKLGTKRIDFLLSSVLVNNYHKTILTGIKSRIPKNVSKVDCEIFELISKTYGVRK